MGKADILPNHHNQQQIRPWLVRKEHLKKCFTVTAYMHFQHELLVAVSPKYKKQLKSSEGRIYTMKAANTQPHCIIHLLVTCVLLFYLFIWNTSSEQFDHVTSLDDQVRIPGLPGSRHRHTALDQV